ncbi:retron Ec78 anti-phage system effector ATPase PtuA [uncultured Pseudoalteromonas sp.]|uniref:retron Ec78 anti-phage system effector ATPase PtuA n=1 Tax=uncultured Pseudoalteromonas sp. TaxID=114053 RepID=UPI002592B9B1|nr:retron Ec78 anti-phage system effector ATPase PtuA [uncultured Pseudoalteromonas sp.]
MKKPKRKSHSKAMTKIESNALKGNLLSLYQLSQNYKTGRFVGEVSETKSEAYFNELLNELSQSRFILDSLSLYNFRCFTDFNISFDDRLTVIIGDNGSGKTSLVEAISKVLTWFNNIIENKQTARPINLADVNVNAKDYSEIVTNFSLNTKTKFEASLLKSAPTGDAGRSSQVDDIKKVAKMYKDGSENNKNIHIPFLAYYSVERSDFKLTQTVSEKASKDTIPNRFSAVHSALEGSGNLEDFSELYIELVNLAEGEISEEVRVLREQIKVYEELIKEAYGDNELPEDDRIGSLLKEKKSELTFALKNACSKKHQLHLSMVNKAIDNIVPDVKDFKVDRTTGKLKLLVSNFGNVVNISQLSQGQKTLVALVGDIARRLVTLNPDIDNPLEAEGIIVIDEVELHLHPRWQQEVLSGLMKTFKNIQFIVTTHSPQVLNHIESKYKIIRFENNGGHINKEIVEDTYGRNTDRIYEDNMEVTSRPKIIENKLSIIFNLIEKRELDKAKLEILNLEDKISSDPQLVKAKTLIKRIELIGK